MQREISNREYSGAGPILRQIDERDRRCQALIEIEQDRLRLLRELREEDRRGSGFFRLGDGRLWNITKQVR